MATATATPGAGGVCGWQHGNAKCLPVEGRTCCSINGFCGSNETYCFTRYGCQYDCVDPPEFYLPISLKATPTTFSTIFATTTATTTATATPSPALTNGQKSGIIAGAILFTLAVIGILVGWRMWRRTHKSADPSPNNQMLSLTRTEANGTTTTLTMPQNFARQHPQLVQSSALFIGNGETPRPVNNGLPPAGQGWRRQQRAETDGHYLYNPDDDRVHDVSSED